MAVFTSVCPRNCYSTCTMSVHVEDGKIRRIEPYAGNKATPEGVCLKGLSYVERQHSPDRILFPLKRSPEGVFSKISWDDALEAIVFQLRKLRREVGPQGLLYYSGSGTKGLLNSVGLHFWRLFGGCTTTYGDLCWPAGLEATRLTLGENKHNAPWDLARAKLIILWGKNPAETNIHQMVFIEQARAAGARLVVIDPRRTQSAERAEMVLHPHPGTDGLLALSIAGLLIGNEMVDRAFIRENVLGYEEFRELALRTSPEEAARITGVAAEKIQNLAQWIGETSPVAINCGYGMQRYTNSGQTIRAIIALLAITGNIGKPGAGWIFANLQSHIFGERDPLAFYPPAQPDGRIRVTVSTARLGQDILACHDPPLRMIWVERGNPAIQNPETPTVLKALRSLDFRVVVDQFLTDTAREADIVLPAKTLFEQTDVINAYWHDYLHLKPKILEPPGEVRPETEIYRELALRLGVPEAEMEGRIPGPSEKEIRSYLTQRLRQAGGPSLEELERGPCLAPGHEEVAFADKSFLTPSGKIELASVEARTRWGLDPLPIYREPVEVSAASGERRRYPLCLLTPNTKNRIHSQFNNLQMIRQVSPGPQLSISPADAFQRGIRAGDRVRVFNDRGELYVEAAVDSSVKVGCVSLTNGWWISDGAAVNQLSKARQTDMGYGAAFHEVVVEVSRAD